MKHISIIVPLGQSSLVNIDGSLQILSEMNVLRAAKGEDPLFHIQLAGLMHQVPQRNGLLMRCVMTFNFVRVTDTTIFL